MNVATIKPHDIANGVGVRVSLFVSGCEHACPACFNPEAWDFSFGEPYTDATESRILAALAPEHIRGLTLLGGEPLHPRNRAVVCALAERVRQTYPAKDIWCYTGYHFEQELLPECQRDPVLRRLLEQLDTLVDGRFVEAKKNLSLRFRGSENQRVLRCRASLAAGEAILDDTYMQGQG
ncbi:MAG: anaerobic ribonucleoside-triphosphate reductase activating protein [Oscillospiraceae bacterium]|nr:anaerobic ribonucleoside-triphosphate reductase activating protein [Oscillospiraceae bacterium]